ncbi:MAG: tRNA (N6-threonylcarbamoyladenosine(37)-N6)-methyltransferase TrmO [Desulfobacteraceae bacterium]
MDTKETLKMIMEPVGIIKNTITAPSLKGDEKELSSTMKHEEMIKRHAKIKQTISEIVIYDRFEGICEGIEDFSHVLVLYWPHLLPEKSRSLLKVHPMGNKDLPEKGIFSTCSPARPNPVLITAVELISRKGNSLMVKGLEAVNGSPVVDIKPYTLSYHRQKNIKVAKWMEDTLKDFSD